VAPLPLEEVILAAAEAGFDAVSILARPHVRAVRAGRTNRELCELIRDSGLFVSEIEAAGDWLGPMPFPAESMFHPVYTVDEFLDIGEALAARTLVATHFGAPAPLEDAAHCFANLCDRAADRGMRVALEFPAMATVADVATAWAIVEGAERPNGGILLDIWHHRRSTGTDLDLARVPPERIFSIQVSDGAAEPVGPPLEDIVHRRLPGEGELGVAQLLSDLDHRGVRCPVGVEVLRKETLEGGAGPAAARLYRALTGVIAASR